MEEICLVCKRSNILDLDFRRVEEEVADCSGKPIKSVLRHIFKCTQVDLEIAEDACLCSKCYKFLLEYDEQVVRLMSLQKRFKVMYENPVKTMTRVISLKQDGDEEMNFDEEIFEEDAKTENSEDVDMSDDDETLDETDLDTTMVVQCRYCGDVFKTSAILRKHVLELHIKKESVCNICNISLKNDEYLELHMNLHEGKSEFDCRYCEKRFSQKSSVIRHMQKHWDKKSYQCEKCGLRFSETPLLYNHKLLHEAEENPLICNICNQTCKTRRTYKRHMNTHREDRPRYPCHICGKTFSEKFTLKPHLRTHQEYVESFSEDTKTSITATDIKGELTESTETTETTESVESHICVICGSIFNNRDTFNKHMQQEHDVITWDT